MAKLTDVNNLKAASNQDWAGKFFFLLKELAVAAGWTVKGSSDGGSRWAYDGETSALPAGQQGSGGDFDAWVTGTGTAHTAGKVAGDPRHDSWLVLENDGRELLLAPTGQAVSNWDGYGRIIYAPKGSGGFDGSAADATTIPGAASAEQEVFGTRANSSGVDVFLYGEGGYVHLWADDAPEAGTLALGFACVDASGNDEGFFCVCPLDAPNSSDDDPAVVLARSSGPTKSSGQGFAWNYGSDAMESVSFTGIDAGFWGGAGAVDPESADDPYDNIPLVLGTSTNEIFKGYISAKALAWSGVSRTYPEIGVDGDGDVFCYFGPSGGFLFPWVDASTAPLP